jgi:hypothetical protein
MFGPLQDQLRVTSGSARAELPKLTYVVCSKRINTRVFVRTPNTVINPRPGTVLDRVVTLPERYSLNLIAFKI